MNIWEDCPLSNREAYSSFLFRLPAYFLTLHYRIVITQLFLLISSVHYDRISHPHWDSIRVPSISMPERSDASCNSKLADVVVFGLSKYTIGKLANEHHALGVIGFQLRTLSWLDQSNSQGKGTRSMLIPWFLAPHGQHHQWVTYSCAGSFCGT